MVIMLEIIESPEWIFETVLYMCDSEIFPWLVVSGLLKLITGICCRGNVRKMSVVGWGHLKRIRQIEGVITGQTGVIKPKLGKNLESNYNENQISQ